MTAESPESLTRRIQQAFDITDVVAEHVKLTRAGKDYRGLCPFHREKTPSFYVVPSKQIFKCFGCGAGGDIFKFIQLRERIDFKEARAILAARAGIPLQSTGADRSAESDRAALARVNDWAMRWFARQLHSDAGAAARRYAEQRGLSAETIGAFALGFAPDGWQALCDAARAADVPSALLVAAGLAKPRSDGSLYDAFRNRLIFPIRDAMERVIGFGGRTLGDDPAKYLNSPQSALFDKARALYGIEFAKSAIPEAGRAVVVEGYLDCVMAHQHGFRNTVATLGTALGVEHARILRRYAESVVLLFDSDEAGDRAVDRALPLFLSQTMDVRLARVPEGKDPCDYLVSRGRDGFNDLLNSAPDALESKWIQLLARCRGAGNLAGRRRAITEFLAVIATAAESGQIDSIQRGLIANQVAKLLGVTAEDVLRQISAREPRRAGEAAKEQIEATRATDRRRTPVVESASRELLEVLLNEPAYYGSIGEHLDIEAFDDAPTRRVASIVKELAAQVGTFELTDVLARLESVEDSQRAVDLQIAGQKKGNLAATVEGAVACLQNERMRSRAGELRSVLRDPHEATEALDEEARARVQLARQHRHFAARRQLNPPLLG